MTAETGQEPTAKPEDGQEPPAGTKDTENGGQEPQGNKQDPPEKFDREYVEKLRAEAAANRKAAKEAQEKLQEKEDAEKSEADKAKSRADRAEARATEAEVKLLRHEVAAAKKVPSEAVDLLQGTTREDLEASADKVLALVKSNGNKPEFDGGARSPAPEQKKPEEAHNELLVQMLTGQAPEGAENAPEDE
jgi:hypothetical protein